MGNIEAKIPDIYDNNGLCIQKGDIIKCYTPLSKDSDIEHEIFAIVEHFARTEDYNIKIYITPLFYADTLEEIGDIENIKNLADFFIYEKSEFYVYFESDLVDLVKKYIMIRENQTRHLNEKIKNCKIMYKIYTGSDYDEHSKRGILDKIYGKFRGKND